MEGTGEPLPGGFLRRHTRVGEPLIADESVVAVRIAFVSEARNRRDHGAETQFACAKCLLKLLARMNIYARAYIAEKVAIRRQTRDAIINYPAVLAVTAPQAILHLKWFLRLE